MVVMDPGDLEYFLKYMSRCCGIFSEEIHYLILKFESYWESEDHTSNEYSFYMFELVCCGVIS